MSQKQFETTTLTTGVAEHTKEIELLKTRKRLETTTEAVKRTRCSRKVARTFLQLDGLSRKTFASSNLKDY